jgi:hypothetical protein
MTQTGLLATRSPSDNMKVVYLEVEERGTKRKENGPNSKAQPKVQEHGCGICDERHRGCDERHASHTPVTGVTHGVTNVTPFPYFVGAGNASET